MKMVMNGLLYDSEKATQIASYDNCLGAGDFNTRQEILMITEKGRYFLVGYGGANTRWCTDNGNTRSGGQGMEVHDRVSALDWCEQHDIDADVINKHFEVDDA